MGFGVQVGIEYSGSLEELARRAADHSGLEFRRIDEPFAGWERVRYEVSFLGVSIALSLNPFTVDPLKGFSYVFMIHCRYHSLRAELAMALAENLAEWLSRELGCRAVVTVECEAVLASFDGKGGMSRDGSVREAWLKIIGS